MLATDRRKLDMAARALGFARAHPTTDASCAALVARLQDRVARADALARLQSIGGNREHSSVAHRNAVRQTLERIQLRHLVRVAELAAKDHPKLHGLFVNPKRDCPNQDFITRAKVILDAAVPRTDLFASCGLGDTFLDELAAAIAKFDEVTDEVHAGRRDHVGATADLTEVADECVKVVGVLDGLYQLRFRRDPESLGAWQSAKHVESGRKRGKKQISEAVVGAVTPRSFVVAVRERLRIAR